MNTENTNRAERDWIVTILEWLHTLPRARQRQICCKTARWLAILEQLHDKTISVEEAEASDVPGGVASDFASWDEYSQRQLLIECDYALSRVFRSLALEYIEPCEPWFTGEDVKEVLFERE